MNQLKQDISSIPHEIISLPKKAYRPDNFNLELPEILKRQSLNMIFDPKFVNNLEVKQREENITVKEEYDEGLNPTLNTQNDKKARDSMIIESLNSLKSEVVEVDQERIEHELKRLTYLNLNMKDQEKLKEIDIAHLDKVIHDIDFTDLEIPEVHSQGDTSVDNDFWEDFNMEKDSEFGLRPKIVVNRSHSETSKSQISISRKGSIMKSQALNSNR